MTAAVARSRTSTSGSGRAERSSTRAGHSRSRGVSSPANVVRPHLRVLDQQALRRRARRRNVALAMFVVLIVGFFAAALAQAQLVANQHELDLLRTRIAESEADRARLERSVEESSAPGAIIDRAAAIGMVRANDPIYLAAVGPTPNVVPISVLGAITASTDGSESATEGLIAASTHVGPESAAATAVSAMAVTSDGDAGTVAISESTGEQLAAPLLAGLAGTRAVATGTGIGTG